MRVVDPGHRYELNTLDGGAPQILTFVKREGAGYPGNVGHYSGTILQEVWRASVDRLKYVDGQIPHSCNWHSIYHLRRALYLLEKRAADRHGVSIRFQEGPIENWATQENGHLLWEEKRGLLWRFRNFLMLTFNAARDGMKMVFKIGPL